MLRLIRFSLVFLVLALLCLTVWRSARTQSPLRRITHTAEEGININPSLSGDGKVVVFESSKDIAGAGGPETLRAIRANVSVDPTSFLQLGITRAPAAAISQDGSRIAFASKDNPLGTNDDANSEIFFHDGSRLIQLTNTSPGDISLRAVNGNFLPSISDDGRFIAFSSNRDLTNQNADGNLEIFICDTASLTFTQFTNSSGIIGFTDAKISGDGSTIAFVRGTGQSTRDLLLQNRIGPPVIEVLATGVLSMTYGRAISDDGQRVVWSAETATNTTQVFLFDGRNKLTRQITNLGARTTDAPLHPTIGGHGLRIAFATRRSVAGMGSNSDASVELYTFDIPSATFARVTNVDSAKATADVLSSMSDDGSVIAFNYPRVISEPVTNDIFAANSEIYIAATPAPPSSGTVTVLNRASMGHEPSSLKAVAPDSIAVAVGSSLSFRTEQPQPLALGHFPNQVAGTSVTVNGRSAQVLFVSPNEVHFHVPAETEVGPADVVVSNSDGFPSRGTVSILNSAPGVFSIGGDGRGAGMILNADSLGAGPFDPTSGTLRLIIFSTGTRNRSSAAVSAGGSALTVESIQRAPTLPGLDEVHVLVPDDLRGAGVVDLVIQADGRDSNSVLIEFSGDARRDILINEFLADPPDGLEGDANRDGTRDASQDEFVELVNTTERDIDIGGYQLLTRSGTSSADVVRHTFPAGTFIPSCTGLVIFGGGNVDPQREVFGGSQVLRASSGSLALGNSTGMITLLDSTGDVSGFVTYGGSTTLDAGDNQSLTRAPDIDGTFAKHAVATAGVRRFSPGKAIDGSPFQPCASAIVRVEISPTSGAIEVGGTQQFVARAFDKDNQEVLGVIFRWQSGDAGVLSIDQNGLVKAVGPGVTTIKATGRLITSPESTIVVKPPPPVLTRVTISPPSATLAAGEVQHFTALAEDQYGQARNVAGITFQSSNSSVATVESVIAGSTNSSATASIATHSTGSAEIRAYATDGPRTVTSGAATIIVEPAAGQLVISEFRTRGPAGAADEFVELYNPTTSAVVIGGLKVRASNGTGTISDRVTITPGVSLGSGCHYLVANNSSSGYSGLVHPDQTYTSGLTDDGGLAITSSDGARIIDAVGMSSGSAYKEGAALTPLTTNANRSYERKPGGTFGNGMDSNSNASDFLVNMSESNPQSQSSNCLNLSVADLSITMTSGETSVLIGAEVTYSLAVTNNGAGLARSVVIADILPAGLTFVSCVSTGGGVCEGSGNARSIAFASLASGDTANVTLVAKTNGPEGSLTNTATVSSAVFDPNSVNNSASTTTVVRRPPPLLSIGDSSTEEGQSGTTSLTFVVTLSEPAPTDVVLDISTLDNTGTTGGKDYRARTLRQERISSGQQEYRFSVEVEGDSLVEPDESFFVEISNVAGGVLIDGRGVGTILNDDTANLVVSQLYTAGGNSGATFANDFVEVFNRGKTSVDFAVTPYSVQYAGAAANFGSNKTNLTSGIIGPGQYFLVQLAGGGSGSPLPGPDAIGSIAMAAAAGKVALVDGTTSLTGTGCSLPTSVADFVGYGATPCFEGNGAAAPPSSSTSLFRKAGGCADTQTNASDFFVHEPAPRNTHARLNNCSSDSSPTISIADFTDIEGNSGSRTFSFVVSLSAPAPATDVSFEISTNDNSATTANNDYQARTLTKQIIPAGQLTYEFSVTVNGDATVEPDETFFVNLIGVEGATVADGQAVGTIQNDDLPKLSISDASIVEGDAGSKLLNFKVSLSSPASRPVTFDISTQDDTATVSDLDFVAQTLRAQVVPAGQQTHSFNVVVNGDRNIEPDEDFRVNLANVSGATLLDGVGIGRIQNDDSAFLTIEDVAINEGNSTSSSLLFSVVSSLPAPAGGIRFNIATHDNTASAMGGDYAEKNLTDQVIPAGATRFNFEVMVHDDLTVELDESFFVTITSPVNATIMDGQAVGTILNDDDADLVISQLYAGGGNSGATFTNDFVEIFNHGPTTVDFAAAPFSVQYAGATANFGSSKVDLTTGSIEPGQYFLVRLAGGPNGLPLPGQDATGTIAMAATAGKVALVMGANALTGTGCPFANNVINFVGYGTTANCFAGNGPTAAPNATTAAVRKGGGCIDSDNNAADFFVHAPAPRNTSSLPNNCIPGESANLSISDAAVVEGNDGSRTLAFTVFLSSILPGSDVVFDIATANNSATTSNNDYEARNLKSQIIPAGQQTYTFSVTINGDTAVEPDETFLVNVINATGANLIDGEAVGTIENDDLPALTINDVSLPEGDSGTRAFNFTVTLSAPAPKEGVVFDIATQNGTATSGDNDYLPYLATAQRIVPGSQTFTFVVFVNGDLKIEPDETFIVNVSNISGAIPVDSQGVGTIQNDDSPKLSINDVAIDEGNSGSANLLFNVSSSLPAPPGGIVFDIATHDASATVSNGDYVPRNLTSQTIPAGQTNYSFSVTVNGDMLVEPNETFLVKLSSVVGASVVDDTGEGAIQNDDVPNVVLSQIYGGGGNSGAVFKNDYIEVFNRGNTIVNLAGWSVQYSSATGASWAITPLCPSSSCLILPGHYFLVEEDRGSGGTVEIPMPDAIGTIAMTAAAGKVAIVSNLTALTGSCPTSSAVVDLVGYGATASCSEGSAPAPAPGNNIAAIRKGGGCVDESNNSGDLFTHPPSPRNSTFPANVCAGQVTDLTINDVTVVEGDAGVTTATFTVTLLGSTTSTVIVDYATSIGTATSPADYDEIHSGQLVFAPGETTKTMSVNVIGDQLDEPDERFLVTLFNATNAAILDNQGQATITDNDVPPTLTIEDVTQNEGNGPTTFNFKIHLSAPALTGGVTFDIATADGTAMSESVASPGDYVSRSLAGIVIPAGAQDYAFNVIVNGDVLDEPNETFFVNVANVSGAELGDGQAKAIIQNDDSAVLTIADIAQPEGNAGTTIINFTVISSLPAPEGGISFHISTADGEAQDGNPATEDNDFVGLVSALFVIPSGQTSVVVPIIVNSDTLVEINETFVVNISNINGASANDFQAVGTIQNDDVSNLVISQIYPGGGNAGATYNNDFIELFNRGTTTIDFALTPYSLQYIGASGSFGSTSAGSKTNILSGRIASGQYFLVQGASGGSNGAVLPLVDATGGMAMAATGGKVALVLGTGALPSTSCPGDDGVLPTNPIGNNIVDFVGYGSGANTPNCFEGLGAAAFSTSTAGGLDPDARSIIRVASCVDNNNNSTDFTNPTTAPVARNKATVPVPCP
ncbi:MAG TPA: Calx-beta domain-containing protein [Pyrinomonadaceae bacterium]|nr:Calx-beta domain-containing protein [Pyrinomonadaceae bacterium]